MNIQAPLARLFTLNSLVWLPVLVGIAGLLFCAWAAYGALAPLWGQPLASLITGAGLLLFAAGLGWWLVRRLGAPTPVASEGRQEVAEQAPAEQALRPVVGDATTEWVRDNTGLAAVAALAAGAILATSPGTRRLVTRALLPLAVRGISKAVDPQSDRRER